MTEEEALESCTNQTEKPLVALGLHRTASNRKQASTTGSFTGPRSGQHRSVRTPAARRQASLRIASTMMAATASSTEGGDGLHQQHGHRAQHHHTGGHGDQSNANTASDAGVTAVISPRAAAPVNALSVVGSPFHGGGGNAEGGVMLQGVKVVEGTSPPDWPATGDPGRRR